MRVRLEPTAATASEAVRPEAGSKSLIAESTGSEEDPILSPKEAATYLEMNYFTFQNAVKAGRIMPSGRVGSSTRPGRFFRLSYLRRLKPELKRRGPGNPNWVRKQTILE